MYSVEFVSRVGKNVIASLPLDTLPAIDEFIILDDLGVERLYRVETVLHYIKPYYLKDEVRWARVEVLEYRIDDPFFTFEGFKNPYKDNQP